MNVTIGDKKTFDDWGLKLQSLVVGLPEAKTNPVDIPGADGVMDLTQALGPVRYNNREIQMIFDVMAAPERWHSLTSEIANYLHGQRLKVILNSDPDYYYIGRLALNSEKSDYYMNHITVTGDMEPYKYEMYSGIDKWKWDSFSFKNGIIRNYKDLVVEGSRTVRITGRKKQIVPTFICSAALEVEWQGIKYPLPAGETKIYAIAIPEGENKLVFYGNGTVSIDYRGGIL